MDFTRDLAGWPHSACSTLIRVRPHDWHVQQMGQGPTLLLLHGTGGSTHSWRDLMPLLADSYHVVAVDLPGHGFTRLGSRHRSALNTMAQDLASLCTDQGWHPVCIIGHSAGGAVALRLSNLLEHKPKVVGINPALQPFQGLAGAFFPVAARVLAIAPMLVDIALRSMAAPGRVATLLASTGSRIDGEGLALYSKLFRNRPHVDGALLMMAQWKLDGLLADLPQMEVECLFLTGSKDRTVPPVSAVETAARMPHASVESFDGLGHLMHEEAPDRVAARIRQWLA
ncbi:MAG: alpha/beta fold hydrolase BchO [Rhodobacterales bacterium]|nr:alpha/beta fold hydrolase BchO [Puniceibacterium antarcticum]